MLIFPKKFNIIIYNKEYFIKIYFLNATFLLFCKVKRKRGKISHKCVDKFILIYYI